MSSATESSSATTSCGNVWRDQENVARAHDDFLAVDDEIQRTFNHVADLLVNVVMHGNVRALLQDDAREHDVGSYDILPRDQTDSTVPA
jgi:hypothetical protein